MPEHTIPTLAETTETANTQQIVVTPNVHVLGRRVIATLLDFIPFGILICIVNFTFGVNQYLSSLSTSAGIPYTSNTAVALPWLYLTMVMYYTIQEALFSRTIGKFLMGLKVVQNDGSSITFMNALIRNILRPIDATSSYLLAWILALCSSRRRRLGDHLAGTLVVSADSVFMLSHRRSRPWLRLSILAILCVFFVTFCLSFDYYGRPPLVIQELTNANAPSRAFSERGTIIGLTLSKPIWNDNTVTYNVTFHAHQHGIVSNCQGNIRLKWSGFLSRWWIASSDTICNPITSRVSAPSHTI